LDNGITLKINFEIEEIDELLNSARPVFDLCKIREPDYVERCAIALILHAFYNGIENIISLIIKNKELKLPNDINWHKKLLNMAFEKTENRSEIFKKELKEPLTKYLKFRHFVRHAYGFKLKWEEMKPLFIDLENLWINIKENINKNILYE